MSVGKVSHVTVLFGGINVEENGFLALLFYLRRLLKSSSWSFIVGLRAATVQCASLVWIDLQSQTVSTGLQIGKVVVYLRIGILNGFVYSTQVEALQHVLFTSL